MVEIVPAILSKTEEDYKNDISKLNESESFQEGWVHIDFMDNEFVLNQSIEPEDTIKFPTKLNKEAHLMVEHPLEWINKLKDAGFDRVLVHYESKDNLGECIKLIKSLEMEAGVVIKNETEVEKLEPYIGKIDLVLIMSVEPGFQGQPFLEESIDRIKKIKSKGWDVRVAVDGAVKDENAKDLVEAGVDQLCVGSFLMKGNADESVEKIWEAIHS